MKKNIGLVAALYLLLTACGGSSQPEEKVVTDTVTVTKTDTVVVAPAAPVVDTAAILAFYEAQNAKSKPSKHHEAAKKVKNKSIVVEAAPTIAAVDAMPVSTASAAAAPEKEVIVIRDTELYYFIPDQKAVFPGGERAFSRYLSNNIQYPEAALDFAESHTVYANVYLDETGKVNKVDFPSKPTGFGFQTEARRVLLNSPKWVPAKQGGQPVKSKFTVPIHFEIKNLIQ